MTKIIEYSLIENGLDFLLSALDGVPFNKLDEKEVKNKVKASILYLSAALELFFKKRLEMEDWKYVFANMNKADEKKYKQREFISVSFSSAIDRLERYANIRFNEEENANLMLFRKRRNNLAHFDFKENVVAIDENIVHMVKLAIKFISEHLLEEIKKESDKNLLQEIQIKIDKVDKYREVLLSLVKKRIEKDGLKLEDMARCPECLEETLDARPNPERKYECYYCGWTPDDYNAEDACEKSNEYYDKHAYEVIFNHVLVGRAYVDKFLGKKALKENQFGELVYPIYQCFCCGWITMVVEGNKGFCYYCGKEFEIKGYCEKCGAATHIDSEEHGVLCIHCLSDLLLK